jgi:putative acetyltransferase
LVDELREAGDAVLSVVAVKDERVVGHAMFSKMKAPFAAAALGPVAVMPELQRNGIGSQLIRYGLAQSEAAGGVGFSCLEIRPTIDASDFTRTPRAALSRRTLGRIRWL